MEWGEKTPMGRTNRLLEGKSNGFFRRTIGRYKKFLIRFAYTGVSSCTIFCDLETLLARRFMVGLLVVSLLGVKATQKREFMAVLISQKFLLLVREGKL